MIFFYNTLKCRLALIMNLLFLFLLIISIIGSSPINVSATGGQCGPGTNDIDCDGTPNGSDPDVDGDGTPNGSDPDVDGDGTPNGSDPDVDGDGIPNGSDPDVDGDGLPNYPSLGAPDPDIDGDGTGNDPDSDDDADGTSDSNDNEPICIGSLASQYDDECTGCWDNIEIVYKTFIPCPVIGFSVLGYNQWGLGDDRTYSYTSNSYRSKSSMTINLNPKNGDSYPGYGHFNDSHDVNVSQVVSDPSDPYCGYKLTSTTPSSTCSNARTSSNNYMSLFDDPNNGCFRRLDIHVDKGTCSVLLAPAINVDMTLFFKRSSDGKIRYMYEGYHDYYPGHELYINGQLVFGYNPRSTNSTVLQLGAAPHYVTPSPWLIIP